MQSNKKVPSGNINKLNQMLSKDMNTKIENTEKRRKGQVNERQYLLNSSRNSIKLETASRSRSTKTIKTEVNSDLQKIPQLFRKPSNQKRHKNQFKLGVNKTTVLEKRNEKNQKQLDGKNKKDERQTQNQKPPNKKIKTQKIDQQTFQKDKKYEMEKKNIKMQKKNPENYQTMNAGEKTGKKNKVEKKKQKENEEVNHFLKKMITLFWNEEQMKETNLDGIENQICRTKTKMEYYEKNAQELLMSINQNLQEQIKNEQVQEVMLQQYESLGKLMEKKVKSILQKLKKYKLQEYQDEKLLKQTFQLKKRASKQQLIETLTKYQKYISTLKKQNQKLTNQRDFYKSQNNHNHKRASSFGISADDRLKTEHDQMIKSSRIQKEQIQQLSYELKGYQKNGNWKLQEQIKRLQSQLKQKNKKNAHLNDQKDQILKKISKYEHLQNMIGQISKLKQEQQKLTQRNQRIKGAIKTIELKLLEKQREEQKLNNLKRINIEIKAKIRDLSKRQKQLRANLGDLQEVKQKKNRKIEGLQKKQEEQNNL